MPLPALETGVPWSWRSFGDYLGALDGNVGLNVGFLVGHCALRRNVMGADSDRQRGDTRAARRDGARCCTSRSTPAASASRRRSRSRTPTATASRSRRAGRRTTRCSRSARAVKRPRGHDARVRHRRLPARLHRRRDRPDGGDDARGPAAAQLERAHDRLARAAALPRPARGVRERVRRAAARPIALTMPILVEMNMSFRNYCALFMLPGLDRSHEPPGARAHREAHGSRRSGSG